MRLPADQITVVTEPSESPISVDDAKTHSRIDVNTEDAYIAELIDVARIEVESVIWRTLVTTVYDGFLSQWPKDDYIELPRPPLQSVSSIKYTDTDGVETTMSSSLYNVTTVAGFGRITLAYGESWPTATLQTGFPIVIRFTAGYGNSQDVPQNAKHMVRLAFGTLHEHRESLVMDQGISLLEIPVLRRMAYKLRAW